MRRPRVLLALLVALPALAAPALIALAPAPAIPMVSTGAPEAAAFDQLACPWPLPTVNPLRPLEHCNVRATAGSGPANEIDLAMDPRDPLHMVAVAKAYNYTRNLPGALVGGVFTVYATTFDGGRTWSEGYLEPVVALPVVGDLPFVGPLGRTAPPTSDPIVEFLPDGALLALDITTSFEADLVYRSDDGGLTWTKIAEIPWGDKPWMVADPSTGRVYVTQESTLYVSDDGGYTWVGPREVPCCYLPGIDVGASGILYLSGIGGGIEVARSYDGGDTWQKVTAAPYHGGSSTNVYNLRLFRTPNPPQIAASRTDGSVYVAWSDHAEAPNLATCNGKVSCPDNDIFVVASHDFGATWGEPVRVNDDALPIQAFQFMPNIAVSPAGDVHVGWMDQRLEPSGLLAEAYYAHSADGGATFGTNLLLSDVPFLTTLSHHQTLLPAGVFVGDYIGIQASDDRAVVAFPDTRYGRADIFVATVV